MKRPLSPVSLENKRSESPEPCASHRHSDADPQQKRELKQQTLTLCEVCNIQLNSRAQAQMHYNGKTHQRRLHKANQAQSSGGVKTTPDFMHLGMLSTISLVSILSSEVNVRPVPLVFVCLFFALVGSPIQGSPLLTSLSLPGRQLQSPLDLKHFLPLRVNGSAPFSLFPNFHTVSVCLVTMYHIPTSTRYHVPYPNFHTALMGVTLVSETDPIQKAVINHTFGLPQIVKKKQIISCNICHLRFNSTSQAEAHYRGHKHARRLKASDHVKNKQKKQGFHMGRDRHTHRQQEKGKTGHTPALIDSSPSERTVPLCDPQAAHVNAEEADAERDPVTFTHISEACLLDTAPPPSPQLSCVPQGSSSFSSKASVPESSSIDSEWAPHPPGEQQSGAGAKEEEAGGKKISKQNLHCAICKVTVNSISQLEAHYSGSKHKLMLEGQCVQPRRRGGKVISSHMNPRPKRHGNKNNATSLSQSHHCHVCDIAVNSESQLKQNVELAGLSSRAGSAFGGICRSFSLSTVTPQNVELAGLSSRAGSAFGGICRSFSLSTVTPQTKLALQKELSKTLTAGFLTSSLTSATLCTMATNPLTLRHTPAPTSIIQSPLLTPGLFRPAPGPLRASHAPIIFSPY
ncbi:hypothetical protein P4O66_011327 [Electrophorus voltai]|uniref:C2H2-type domain-containing protein n=1 Tax=Electrophorus voltai TaxID=2609070 RepID=A0AAD9DV94_9TELE|nr:hypothetical protein P4O66_011327 [Electrophorus voltai]